MTENLNLKGGVLIIGSLIWQDHLKNEKGDNIRKLWRDRNLLIDHKIILKVPIRYGRLSNDDIYTMTFSNSCSRTKNGTGYFVPFRKTPITTLDGLLSEAKETSIAEGMNGKFLSKERGTENVWCVLGILINPKNVAKEKQTLIKKKWEETLISQGTFDINDFKIGREKPCINKNGVLNISWPIPVDKRDLEILNSYDFIIATGTKPTKYPTSKELVDKVKGDKTRHYFIENYKSGITTFQDLEVINKLT